MTKETQPDMFGGVATGMALRDEALDRVGQANRTWVDECVLAIVALARRSAEFTTDDVWYEMTKRRPDAGPREPRAMGAAMRQAATMMACAPTSRTTKSRRPACHARPLRVWRSLLIR